MVQLSKCQKELFTIMTTIHYFNQYIVILESDGSMILTFSNVWKPVHEPVHVRGACTGTAGKHKEYKRVLYSSTLSLSCSPLNLQGSIRHSSSSLSSHTSSEAGNLVIMTDGLMGEHPEEGLHMQVRLETKSHGFTHECSNNGMNLYCTL